MRPDTQPDSLRVRPYYFGPTCNHASRVDVGVLGVVAGEAREAVACLPVALLDVAADAALPGSVSRVDVADGQPCTASLVGNLRLKIAEGPRVQGASLLPASPYPRADAIEVLDGDPAPGAFGRGDDLLGDHVVRVLGEAMLLHPAFSKQPLRALGSLLLEFASQTMGAAPQAVEVRAGEVLPLARGGDVDDADVDTKPAESLLLFGVRHVYAHEEVELPGAEHEVGLAPLMRKQSALAVAADEADALATLDGPDARRLAEPRQNASVVRDRSERPECSQFLPVELVGVGNLGNATHDDLRGEVGKLGARRVVDELMDRELSERCRLPRALREPVTGGVRAAQRRRQRSRLDGRWLELHLNRQLHAPSVARSILETKTGLLPAPKDGVSVPEKR